MPPQFAACVSMGALTGAAIVVTHEHLLMGVSAGIMAPIIGTLLGYKTRAAASRLFGRDLPPAPLEDIAAIVLLFVALG